MEIIGFIIFGLIIGAIAKFIMPGKDPGGFFVTAIIGMIGSVVGGYLARFIHIGNGGGVMSWVMAIVGTLLLLFIYRLIASRQA
jgi:uncharacterized membrane protein YeaQ/YmgE (transglycosylase-associated protein family)